MSLPAPRMLAWMRSLPGLAKLPGGWPSRLILAGYWVTLLVLTHWPKLDIHVTKTQTLSSLNLDKPIHAMTFGGLTLLAILAGLAGTKAPWRRHVITAAVLISGYAYIDELTQHWFDRYVCSGDLLANLTGIMAVSLAMLAISRRNSPGPWQQTACRLVLVAYSPLALIMTFSSYMALNATWPDWFMAMFTTEHGPRQLIMFALGASVMFISFLAMAPHLQRLIRPMFVVLLGMLMAGGVLWLGTFVNPVIHWQDSLLWCLGAICTSIALTAAWRATQSVRQLQAKLEKQQAESELPPEMIDDDNVEPDSSDSRQFVGHARTVSILTLLSRVTGLVREAVIAAVFGLSPVAAAFVFAFQIPNLFRRLFGEGALSAAVIPVYAKTLREDPVIAKRFVSLCIALLMITLGGLTLLGEAALATALIARDWTPDTALALRLSMLMLPYMPLVCLVALIGAILQVRGRFASTAAVPVVLNIVVVAGALLAAWQINASEPAVAADTADAMEYAVYIVGWSVLAAGLLQVAWQAVSLLKVQKLTTSFAGTRPSMISLKAIFIPMVLGLAAFQINTFLDAVMAMGLSSKQGSEGLTMLGQLIRYPLQESAVAALGWSQRLYEFPLGIFGIAIATAIFPALSHAAAQKNAAGRSHFTTIFHHGLRLSVFIGLPASVGLMAVSLPLSRLAYERGEFDFSASMRVSWILMGYAPAIWAYSMNHVLTRAFYAQGDSRTPLRVSLAMVALNLLMNLILVWPLGAQGFALATAIGAVLQCVILLKAMGRSVGEPLGKTVWLSWGRSLLASVVMATLLVPALYYFDPASLTRTHSAFLLLGMVSAGGLVYLGTAWVLKCEEIRWLVRRKHGA